MSWLKAIWDFLHPYDTPRRPSEMVEADLDMFFKMWITVLRAVARDQHNGDNRAYDNLGDFGTFPHPNEPGKFHPHNALVTLKDGRFIYFKRTGFKRYEIRLSDHGTKKLADDDFLNGAESRFHITRTINDLTDTELGDAFLAMIKEEDSPVGSGDTIVTVRESEDALGDSGDAAAACAPQDNAFAEMFRATAKGLANGGTGSAAYRKFERRVNMQNPTQSAVLLTDGRMLHFHRKGDDLYDLNLGDMWVRNLNKSELANGFVEMMDKA